MRMFKSMMVMTAMTLMLLPSEARAQELAGLVKRLFDNSTYNRATFNAAGALVSHQPHFIVGENLRLITRQVNVALASQLASFPLPSSAASSSAM